MVISSLTVTFSDLVLQIIVGAIVAALVGRAVRGGGFGILGDLLFGVLAAIGANWVVAYFKLFNLHQYGLIGELIVAAIGAIILVMLIHMLTYRRSTRVVSTSD
jgi:uncharacterized membrane protein YeaQ/YmgE (transglycosylase-associated protein family)